MTDVVRTRMTGTEMARADGVMIPDLPEDARVLDAGGWANPHPRATHVADFYPWETRTGRLLLAPEPDERFTRGTWFQVNFCKPGMRIPVSDKYFDFAICTHTLEDLRCPSLLMDELSRVARAGFIQTPSRLTAQTVGVSDRSSTYQGYNHHKWIVENDGALVFYDKRESLYGRGTDHRIPLRVYERLVERGLYSANVDYPWKGEVAYRICEAGDIARKMAREFKASLRVSRLDVSADKLQRLCRRLRDGLRGVDCMPSGEAIRLLSQRYSTLDLA